MRLASAFPVPGPDGRFTTVRISTYVYDSATVA
jgi:hypothetical protein